MVMRCASFLRATYVSVYGIPFRICSSFPLSLIALLYPTDCPEVLSSVPSVCSPAAKEEGA